jgi:hypothetical protein
MSGVRARNDVRRVMVPNFREVDETGSTVRTVTSNGLLPGPFHSITGVDATVARAPGSRVDLPAVSAGRTDLAAARPVSLPWQPPMTAAAVQNAVATANRSLTVHLHRRLQREPAAERSHRHRESRDDTDGSSPGPSEAFLFPEQPPELHDRRRSYRETPGRVELAAVHDLSSRSQASATAAASTSSKNLSTVTHRERDTAGIARLDPYPEAVLP